MNYKYILKNFIIGILAIIGIFIICKISIFYVPFFIAYIISLLIEPLIKWVAKKTNCSRKISSVIVLISIFIIAVSIISWGIISLISESTNLLNGLNNYIEKGSDFVKNIYSKIDWSKLQFSNEVEEIIQNTSDNFFISVSNFIKNTLNKFLDFFTSIPTMFIYVIITILATYFIVSDKFYILDRLEHHLSKKMMGKIMNHVREITKSLGGYLKAEITLIGISFIIVLFGLNLFCLLGMNIKYPILMAILIGFVDALPILGTGTIMIPWSCILFFNNNTSLGLSILGLYIFILVAKQILEPKIVSSNIGIHPIFTLIAMYTGFKLIGIIGLLVGPIMLIILKNIFSEVLDKGIVTSIIEED